MARASMHGPELIARDSRKFIDQDVHGNFQLVGTRLPRSTEVIDTIWECTLTRVIGHRFTTGQRDYQQRLREQGWRKGLET